MTLDNELHEKFAKLIAGGETQHEAARLSGLGKSRANASKIRNIPAVAARIEELRPAKVGKSVPLVPDLTAPAGSLARMGYTPVWFAAAFSQIADHAKSVGQFGAANNALSKVQGLYEEEAKGRDGSPRPAAANQIDITALGAVLDKVAGVISASKAPDSTANAVPEHAEMKALRALEDADSEA